MGILAWMESHSAAKEGKSRFVVTVIKDVAQNDTTQT